MINTRKALQLYAITDRNRLNTQTFYQQVEHSLLGGIRCLQLREKTLSYEPFLAEAIHLKQLTKKYHVPLIINDNLEIALACNADGIHIGQFDMDAKLARSLLGPDKLIGVTAKTVDQAISAEKNGADYLGVGAVFPSQTKPDAIAVTQHTLVQICSCVSIPIVAVGGISKETIPLLSGTGIAGIAVVSAIFSQSDIQTATKELLGLSGSLVDGKFDNLKKEGYQ